MTWLSQIKVHTDVIFIVGNTGFPAHKFILAAASPVFNQLFFMENEIPNFEMDRSSSESSLVKFHISKRQ